RVCLMLPSDSTSRWTPLPSANTSNCNGVFGTYTLELSPMPGTPQKSRKVILYGFLYNRIIKSNLYGLDTIELA
ncbi:hypothetical protein, partial [Sphingobacterium alimentarium]|uniref:hypothetical protein n=1 Tax=Sphingobacterium alimentarium TaxID=797292 RepID=UPI001A9E3A09